jgi:hypothetical protein
MGFTRDWTCMNTLPEWFTVEAARKCTVIDPDSGSRTIRTGQEFREGMEVILSAGTERRLIVRRPYPASQWVAAWASAWSRAISVFSRVGFAPIPVESSAIWIDPVVGRWLGTIRPQISPVVCVLASEEPDPELPRSYWNTSSTPTSKGPGDAEGQGQRGGVFAGLDGDDRLARDADLVRELLLGHLAVIEPQPTDAIGDLVVIHPCLPGHTGKERRRNT